MYKDKLEKTGLTKLHYAAKDGMIIFLLVLAFLTLISIPLGISYKIGKANSLQEETSSLVATSSEVNLEK